ncbi:hypothetical protein C3Y87_05295 [Carbonactinospora thermoautotrophica]|uniref:hypothetical protein n=1 Tax=Carbonactinospora thermoautotrophica TaxID=1469144 RepID=UPI00227066D0|nr:hypothetical protein [Carbonactinospora thermoautotrophica]MCX9190835.1 hypothetical protein [Carbonactinospora thermoautotrophica]
MISRESGDRDTPGVAGPPGDPRLVAFGERVRALDARWSLALVLSLLLLVSDAAVSYVALDSSGQAQASERAVPDEAGARRASVPGQNALVRPEPQPGYPEQREIVALLNRRAAAMLRHDGAAFLATIDAQAGSAAKRQVTRFANQAEVPFAEVRYTGTDARPIELTARRAGGLGAVVQLDARLEYRIKGFDEHAVGSTVRLVLVRRSTAGQARWYVHDERPAGGDTPTYQLWDFGRVNVVRGEHSLVMGLHETATLRRYANEVDRAVPGVDAVWGGGWFRRVVVEVPRTEEQMARLLGARPGEYSQIAAVTIGEFSLDGRRVADRIIVNPEAFRKLTPLGRMIVTRHELTHVATRGVTRSWTPTWLTEGFADYVGYRRSGVPVRTAAAELLEEVRGGDTPAELPDRRDFETANPRLAQAYEQAWLACRYLVEEYGEDKLVTFYRAVGQGPDGEARALRTVLGTTEEEFTAGWREYLEKLAK